MALTFNTGMTEISDADSLTDWAVYKITAGGATPTLDLNTNVKKEGTGCIGIIPTASKDCGMIFNYYNANGSTVLDLTTVGNEVIQYWMQSMSSALVATIASGGLYLIVTAVDAIPSSSNKWAKWYIGGSDNHPEGWNSFMIDTRKTPSATNGGWTYATDAPNTYRIGIGALASSATAWKAENIYIDRMAYGRPIYTLTGDGVLTADWADFLSDADTEVNGLIQDINGAFEVSCGIQFGDDSQTATTTFVDATNQTLNWKRYQYYSSGMVDSITYADYYKISAEGAASYLTSVTLGSLVGTDAGILGGQIKSLDPTNVPVIIDFNTDQAHITALNMYGVTFSGITGTINLGANSSFNYFSCSFIDCDQVDPDGACEIRNTLFIDTSDTVAALLWDANIDIQDCTFIANTTGAAIEHDTWDGTASGTATNTGSETTTLYDTTASFTTTVAVNDIVYNETDDSWGRVTVVVSNTELTHTALSGGTNNYWTTSDAYSVATPYDYTNLVFSGNTYDIDNTTSPANVVAISKAGTSNPSAYPTGDFVAIQGSVSIQITVKDKAGGNIQNAQTAVYLTSDMSEILNTDTNASGVASTTYAGSTPAAVLVRVRKSEDTDDPRYFPFSKEDTISTSGLTLTVTLEVNPFI
jgi:hypothetical protein